MSRTVEFLLEGKLGDLLKDRGIEVSQIAHRVRVYCEEKNGEVQKKDFGILAISGTEVVVIEMKTTLMPSDVSYFLENLKSFKKYCPEYKSHTVYGAVAYLSSESEAHLSAEREGLFVIQVTEDSASIINKESFKPKAFCRIFRLF